MNTDQWRTENDRDSILGKWERLGRPIPGPPEAKQATVRHYADWWGIRTLAESGTYLGQMVASVNDLFEDVYTIELSDMLYEQATRTFADHHNVTCLHGDSAQVLPGILDELDHRALLWLDGHFSEGNTALGDRETPIVAELAAALGRPERHVILIDDARCFADGADPHPDYPTISWVAEQARDHGYKFALSDDIMRLEPIIDRPSFSILMPTFNRPQLLGRAVEAILNQTGVDFQLIVKNGGDGVRSVLPSDPRVVHVTKPDTGIADAMNQAAEVAEGDIWHWANDDDIMHAGTLEFVATWLDDAIWGFGRIRMIDATAGHLGLAGGGAWDPARNLAANGIPQPATFWRSGVMAKVGGFDTDVGVCADFDLYTRLGHLIEPKITERVLASYTVHPDSFTVRHPHLLAESADRVRAKHRG